MDIDEAKRDEALVEFHILHAWSLSEVVQCFVEAHHLPLRSGLDKSWRMHHAHLLFKLPVEERGLDVEVVYLPPILRSNGGKEADEVETHDGGKDLLKVNSL
jgi:hypothetical protein